MRRAHMGTAKAMVDDCDVYDVCYDTIAVVDVEVTRRVDFYEVFRLLTM